MPVRRQPTLTSVPAVEADAVATPAVVAAEVSSPLRPVHIEARPARPLTALEREAAAFATPARAPTPPVVDPLLGDEPEIIVLHTVEDGRSASVVARATAAVTRRFTAPSLVIDDEDPESAEREREARTEREPARRSFLPPILLDDEPAPRGGLTLAVIILLIVATLTLSYLMRRPSSSGEGVTSLPAPAVRVA